MGYYNKFDPTKSIGAYYWYVKIPQLGYVGHELKCIASYVKKHSNSSSLLQLPPGSRLATSGARICERRQFNSMTYCVCRCNFLCIISAGILMPALLGDEKKTFLVEFISDERCRISSTHCLYGDITHISKLEISNLCRLFGTSCEIALGYMPNTQLMTGHYCFK